MEALHVRRSTEHAILDREQDSLLCWADVLCRPRSYAPLAMSIASSTVISDLRASSYCCAKRSASDCGWDDELFFDEPKSLRKKPGFSVLWEGAAVEYRDPSGAVAPYASTTWRGSAGLKDSEGAAGLEDSVLVFVSVRMPFASDIWSVSVRHRLVGSIDGVYLPGTNDDVRYVVGSADDMR